MFLTGKDYTIEDMLQALKFIPPKGQSVAYIIAPHDIGMPQNSPFEKKNPDTPPDESQVYVQKNPIEKVDQGISPAEYSIWDPEEPGRRQPTPNVLPDVTDPLELDSPFVQVLSESIIYGTDIRLLEKFHMFPKNTVFHCVKDKLQEGVPKDYEKYDSKRYGKEFSAPDYISHNGTTRWERVQIYKWIDHLLDDLGRSQWQNAIDLMTRDKRFMSNFENERDMRKAVVNHLYHTKQISYRQFENYCDSLYPKPVETLEDVLKRPHTKGDLNKFKEAAELKKPA